MKTVRMDPAFFTRNRERLAAQLEAGAIAVVNSNDQWPTNADGTMPFRQNNDLYYLTGVVQEESTLLLFPSYHDPEHREVLFLREGTELLVKWEGRKLTKEQATEVTGIKKVYWQQDFEAVFRRMVTDAEAIYLNTNEHKRSGTVEIETKDDRFRHWCQKHYPLHRYARLAPLLMRQRALKSAEEVEQLKEAIRITGEGHKRLMRALRPGVMEYELEAEIISEYIRQGGRLAGYEPIVASGSDTCILHYIENSKACKDGELVLVDAAAGYGMYHADLTRTLPVNGRFTDRQRAVYNAVLSVMKEARAMMVPGAYWKDIQAGTEQAIERQCVRLGLIKVEELGKQAWRKYFYHGVAHFLGLDVHDVGYFHEPIQAGMVFTCEPGLYIWDEGLGIRLENNILVTDSGPRDLMEEVGIVIEADEVEEYMNSGMAGSL